MKKLGGMVWPVDGNQGFLCVLVEKTTPIETTLDTPKEYIEIVKEIASSDINELFTTIGAEQHLERVYVPTDIKFLSFIHSYAEWRRRNGCGVLLRTPQISSFEAGVMKIKEYTSKKTIVFPENSIIRSQLMVFSKLSLKNEAECYAVSALTQVIQSFSKRRSVISEEEPPIKNWY